MVKEPEKELRFTRSGQAVWFGLLGAVMFGVFVTLVTTAFFRHIDPGLPHWLWSVPFFMLTVGSFWLVRRLTRHAYLILTPIGVEILPFFRPEVGMRIVMWQEIVEAEIDKDERWLSLHFNQERTAGVHITLMPLRKKLRCLLAKAVLERISRQKK